MARLMGAHGAQEGRSQEDLRIALPLTNSDGYTALMPVQTTQAHSNETQQSLDKSLRNAMQSRGVPRHPCGCKIMDPVESLFLEVWDVLVGLALIVTVIVGPFEVAFLHPKFDGFFVLDRILDALFVSDMVVQFFTMCPDPRNNARFVRDWKEIAFIYLSGWFWVDLLSVLPIDFLCALLGFEDSDSTHSFKAVRLFRLVRLVRLARFGRLLQRWHTSFGFSFAVISLFKFLCYTVSCCHWMACVWGGIGLQTYVADPEAPTWIAAVQQSKVLPADRYTDPLFIYSISLYWSIMTLTGIGYGDIVPQSAIEYRCATLCMAMMAAVWAYVIGAVCGIVATLEPHSVQFKRTMDDLNTLMEDRHMPHPLRRSLRQYFNEAKKMRRRADEQVIINQMSPKLQGEVAVLMHRTWLSKVWYLANMDAEVVVEIARQLHGMVFAPSESMPFHYTLFILQRGICALRGRVMKQGDIWGDDMILDDDSLIDHVWARSFSYVEVILLSRYGLDQVLRSFPKTEPLIRKAQVRLTAIRGLIKVARLVALALEKGAARWKDLSEAESFEMIKVAAHTQWPHMRPLETPRTASKQAPEEPHAPGDATMRRINLGLPPVHDVEHEDEPLHSSHLSKQLQQVLHRVDYLTEKVDELSRIHKREDAGKHLKANTKHFFGE